MLRPGSSKPIKNHDTYNIRIIVSTLLYMTLVPLMTTAVPNDEVWTQPTATFWLGDTGTKLPCEFVGTPIAVYWIKGETISTGTTLVTWYDRKTSGPGKDDGTLDLDENFSLVFTAPQLSDTGRYICRVSNYNGYLIHNQTELRVLDPAENIASTLPSHTGWKGEASYLPCDFLTKTPERVIWNKVEDDGIKSVVKYSDGAYESLAGDRFGWGNNFALKIKPVEFADIGNFTCEVLRTDGSKLKNVTVMALINARPEKPYIRIRDCSPVTDSNLCTYNAYKSQKEVHLSCTVFGAKPNVSVYWTVDGSKNKTIGQTTTQTLTLSDGSFNTTSVLTRKLNLEDDAENITCAAEGLAVDGYSELSTTFEVVPEPTSDGGSSSASTTVIIVVVILIIAISAVIVVAIYVWRRKSSEPPTRECDVESVPLIDSITKKRTKITEYRPNADSIEWPEPMNIGLFGVASVGKSALINSMKFALTGEFKAIAAEATQSDQGSKTLFREPVNLTEHIQILDNRGMADYSTNTSAITILMDQIQGKKGLNPKDADVKDGIKVDCPIVVCKTKGIGQHDTIWRFITAFSKEVKLYYGRDVLIVVTHDKCDEDVDEKNYTEDDHSKREEVPKVTPDSESNTKGNGSKQQEPKNKKGSEGESKENGSDQKDNGKPNSSEEKSGGTMNIKDEVKTYTSISSDFIYAFDNYTEKSHVEDKAKSVRYLDFIQKCIDVGEANIKFRQLKREGK